ncbi:MAG: hypothetical protein KA118_16585 [Verrucomicrobia bacterium]|nr:hypothetical protein [Verrucomicrobiota bacterium]
MSATACPFEPRQSPPSGDIPCGVFVFYGDHWEREVCLALCDQLVRRFWQEIDFDFHWWRHRFLEEPALQAAAEQDAVLSDLWLIAWEPARDFEPASRAFLERAASQRLGRPGALVAAANGSPGPPAWLDDRNFLRQLGKRMGMDFFVWAPQLPPDGPQENDREGLEDRATRMTHLLEDMLQQLPPPSHWGINE